MIKKTASDELNDLGTFATIDAVYAMYPSGGLTGNYVKVNGVTLHWNENTLRWQRK